VLVVSPCCGAPADRWIGVEVKGIFDGVLYWGCGDCGTVWNRWTTEHHLWPRAEIAMRTAGCLCVGDRADGLTCEAEVSAPRPHRCGQPAPRHGVTLQVDGRSLRQPACHEHFLALGGTSVIA
jgi:hypothetical protein